MRRKTIALWRSVSDSSRPTRCSSISNATAMPGDVRGQQLIGELVGYAIAASLGLVIDVGLLKVLVDFVGWHYLPAAAVAFMVAAAVTYLLSVRFVFQSKPSSTRIVEFLQFAALGLVGLLINMFVLSISISVAGVGLLTAKAIATICAFIINFFLRRRLLIQS